MVRRLMLSAVALPLLAACASFQASAMEVAPQQQAALEATCTKVMRLHKGEAEFEGCVSSLSDALAGQIQYGRATDAYRDCGQNGLSRNTPEFSRCVLDRENTALASSRPLNGATNGLDASNVKPADANPRDYYETSFDMRHRREQYSCAQLGLAPDSEPFVTCVNNLDMNLFLIEHPNG